MNTQFQKGMTPWNKGLTKADPRVLRQALKITYKIEKICEVCKKAFWVNQYRDKTAKFCSRTCRSSYFGKEWLNPNSFNRENWNKYVALHNWVNKTFGKASKCEVCKAKNKKVYHWASRNDVYTKRREDWFELCPKCHYAYDRIRRDQRCVH